MTSKILLQPKRTIYTKTWRRKRETWKLAFSVLLPVCSYWWTISLCLSWDPPECQGQYQKHGVSGSCMHLLKLGKILETLEGLCLCSIAMLCSTGQQCSVLLNSREETLRGNLPSLLYMMDSVFALRKKIMKTSSLGFGPPKKEN